MRTSPILFILIVSLLTLSACSKAEGQLKVGDAAPDFTLETVTGEKIALSDVLKEKKVVLDFWASWCPPCVRAISELEEFYSENKDKVEIIGINIKESKPKVASFIRKKGISYPVVLDSDGKVAGLYNVRSIPTIVAVDKTGEMLYYGHSVKEMTGKVDFN